MRKELDPLLHSALRLKIVSVLVSLEEADFLFLQEQTGATSGNLSVQLDKLASAGYIEVEKTFQGKKPRTLCRMTSKGIEAFRQYADALKAYLNV
jgi:DNA-binding MarR family transcriptional regulator